MLQLWHDSAGFMAKIGIRTAQERAVGSKGQWIKLICQLYGYRAGNFQIRSRLIAHLVLTHIYKSSSPSSLDSLLAAPAMPVKKFWN